MFLSYILSFVYLAVYWNNHHHMLHATTRVTGYVMWANMNLLFWLSLFPFVTAWMGENHFAQAPVALYGIVLLMADIAHLLLQRAIIASQGHDSILAKAVGRDYAVVAASIQPWISGIIYVLVPLMWLAPDPRIERAIGDR